MGNLNLPWRILICRDSCGPPYLCVKLVIHDLTCGFRLVSFTAQNLISRGLPIFGSFCKPLRNVVTETIAEHSANWEVSSNRILTGRPSGSFINKCQISDSLFDVRFLTFQFHLLTCEVTRAPNFQTVLQTSEEFCKKTFQSCSRRVPILGGLQAGFDFFDL